MSEVLVVTFTCRSCETVFTFESPDLRIPFRSVRCPQCNWCPLDPVKDDKLRTS